MYADLSTVIDVCKPCLNENSLVVIQKMSAIDNRNSLITTLFHESGQSIDSVIYLPDLTDPQKLTAAITYLRRSTYLSILGLVADDDNDGNELTTSKPQQPALRTDPQPPQSSTKQASDKQKALVKRNMPSMDVTNMSAETADKLIKEIFNKGK